MRREAPTNRIAKLALAVALVSCLFGQTLPAMAQYSLQAEQDAMLPPDVVPLDPAVGQRMSQAQAAARQNNANNSYNNGQQSAMAGDPSMANGMSNGMSNGMPNNMSNDQGMQNNFNNQSQGQFNNMQQANNMGQPNGNAPGSTGTSDWIMPNGQDQNAPMTAYGNVSQTQTLTAPPSNPIVRRSTRRGGMGTAVSALAGFGAGAMVGTMIRRPNTLFGLGATGLFMTGFGTRNGFRF